MRLIRGLATALIGMAVVLGLAVPAHAQGNVKAPGVPEGYYNVNIDGQATATWEIYPICVPTVGDLREPLLLPIACRLKVTPNTGQGGAEAVMVMNQWQFVYKDPEGRTCPDGSKAPQETVYRFDPYNWTGTMKVLHGGECGDQPAMVVAPLTMSFKGPLPNPVTQYPLLCEPGGLRRCF
ncbi:hypothetical protein H7J93_23470 [Mycobacterium barrassiae]|uniref:hypothetical protein n=1 Tax=Mycobacterium barrassiae TaxID=319709 RepID=UPI002265C79D|nr:hypothetical protein [Mycobacterium barrassiae]MCV7302589.1 hypothetical protein [Mycobacterium barrassiae]